jgi:lipid-A-disaccharide synthase
MRRQLVCSNGLARGDGRLRIDEGHVRGSPGIHPLTFFFSAGEPSGDLHAATLLQELRRRHPAILATGFGGRQLALAGCHLQADLTQLAIMWFGRVFSCLPYFLRLAGRANRLFRKNPPAAVILVDYPGFNWWVARLARRQRIPVIYYVPPQIWAWARWRVGKMRRLVDLVLCTLPFEAEFFRRHNCPAIYIGHPFFDHLAGKQLDERWIAQLSSVGGPWVTLLPGSRFQELEANFETQLQVARRVYLARPDVRFAVAAYSEQQAAWLRERAKGWDLPLEIWAGRTQELIRLARCCVAVSGSVALELMYYERPSVILYRIGPGAWWAQGFFRQVRYICLVNLLAAEDPLSAGRRWPALDDQQGMVYPEYLTYRDPSPSIAVQVLRWLGDDRAWAECVAKLRRLKSNFARPGAAASAAECILDWLYCRLSPAGFTRPDLPHLQPPVIIQKHAAG